MSYKRYANKIDGNQEQIIKDLESYGFIVIRDHDDILVSKNGRLLLVEIKNKETSLNKNGTVKKGAIKPSQVKMLELKRANEYDLPYLIAWTTSDILAWFGIKGHKRTLCGDCWLLSTDGSPICYCED